MSIPEKNIDKIKKSISVLEKHLDVAEVANDEDISDFINTKMDVEILNENEINQLPEEIQELIIEMDSFRDDFNFYRDILKQNIVFGRKVIQSLSEKLVLFDEDIDPEFINAYSNLMKTVNTAMSTMTKSYHEVSETQIKLKKMFEEKNSGNESNSGMNVQINNFNGSSTKDMIERLKKK